MKQPAHGDSNNITILLSRLTFNPEVCGFQYEIFCDHILVVMCNACRSCLRTRIFQITQQRVFH